jgi:hypothetical protein
MCFQRDGLEASRFLAVQHVFQRPTKLFRIVSFRFGKFADLLRS